LEELDWSVGQVLSTLTAHGIADNTLVLFTSGRSLCCTYLPPITHVHTHTASSIQTPSNPLAQRTFAQANFDPTTLSAPHALTRRQRAVRRGRVGRVWSHRWACGVQRANV
jgi:hypothetical protein